MTAISVTIERALAAGQAIAVAHGVCCGQAAVIHAGSNVVVHLRPSPVVARVMTGTVALHEDPRRWLEREVSVLTFLAPHALAVSPSPLIDPGPYEHDGLWLTCWEWVEHERQTELPADAEPLGRGLRDLHRALSAYGGELGHLQEVQADIERLLGQLRPTATLEGNRIESLRNQLYTLGEEVFASSLPAQPLHGDASLTNLLRTRAGVIWNDFEDVCSGPVHWDVAGVLSSLRGHGADSAFTRRVLDAYGGLDEQALIAFVAADDLYGEIWHLYDTQRR